MRRRKRRNNLFKLCLVTAAVIIVFALLLWTFLKSGSKNSSDTSTNSVSVQQSSSESLSQSSQSDESSQSEESSESEETSESSKEDETSQSSSQESSQQTEKNVQTSADDSYFDDAVFIGDSRTEGLILYGELFNAHSLAYKGLTASTAFTDRYFNINGTMMSAVDALSYISFSKVYIMLGINELGWAYSNIFIDKYAQIIDAVKSANPNAVVYVQSILPVSDEVSRTHDYISNKKINEYNELLKNMAAEKGAVYLDVAEVFKNSNGCLPDDAAWDGIHLKKPYCEEWLEYLKQHTA